MSANIEPSLATLGAAAGVAGGCLPASQETLQSRTDAAAGARRARDLDLGGDGDDEAHRSDFLAELRRAARSSVETGAPLSVAVFAIDPARHSGIEPAIRLVKLLHGAKRESDVLGYLDGERAALILRDTGETGAARLVQRIATLARDVLGGVQTASYPSPQFDRLIIDCEELSASAALPPYIYRGPQRSAYALKRPLDVAGAAACLLALSPLMLAAAIAVKLDSRGPVIFRQERLGYGGVPFKFYKFRSMATGGDDRIHREYVRRLIEEGTPPPSDDALDGPLYKLSDDPRITRVGRFLRRTSIDELPQLWNVLKGDMSLVGPRPPLPYETAHYRAWHLRRLLDAKPGLTGLWQVSGRSNVSFDDMVRMDLRYIRKCSLRLDLRILLRTVMVVLGRDGAS